MRKSRFSEDQIVSILKEHDAGEPTGTLLRRRGISEQTLYRWRHKYDGLEGQVLRRLMVLEEENARLKRLVAEQALDNQALKELLRKKLVRPTQQRAATAFVQEWFGLSQRRACGLVRAVRSTVRYQGRQRDDHPLRIRLAELAV